MAGTSPAMTEDIAVHNAGADQLGSVPFSAST